MQDGGLSIPQPQIIAFLGTLTPKCPNPDLSLPFDPAEIATSSQPQAGYFEQLRSIAGIERADRLATKEHQAYLANARQEFAKVSGQQRMDAIKRLSETTLKLKAELDA